MAERRTIHVWSESEFASPDPGYDDGHTLGTYHGKARATTLGEAADIVFDRLFDTDPNYNRKRLTYYGCRLFEREPQYV